MDDEELTLLVKSCLKKRRYPNEQSALEAINRVHKERNTKLRVYFCEECLGYHLTHRMEKPIMNKSKLIVVEKLTNVELPNKAYKTDAGFDFYLPYDLEYIVRNGKNVKIALQPRTDELTGDKYFINSIEIEPHKSVLLPMGIKTSVPYGHALVFFNRSGIASKKHLLRGACIVDSDYRGEVFVNLNNVSDETQYLEPGEKLIQAMLLPVPPANVVEGKVENNTERGAGGFGSTNNK